MSSRPTLPTWATNTDYAAGSDPWSSTPTKSAPSAGKMQSGYVPAAEDAAEEDNWLLNAICASLAFYDNAVAGPGDVYVREEFTGGTIADHGNTPRYVNIFSVFTSDGGATVTADTGAAGILSLSSGNSNTLESLALALGTTDIAMSWRIKVPDGGGGAGTDFYVGLKGGASSRQIWFQSLNRGTWHTVLGSASAVDTGVNVGSSSYYSLTFVRVAGSVTFLINGAVVVGPTTYATDLTDVKIHLRQDASGGGTAQNINVDSVMLLGKTG